MKKIIIPTIIMMMMFILCTISVLAGVEDNVYTATPPCITVSDHVVTGNFHISLVDMSLLGYNYALLEMQVRPAGAGPQSVYYTIQKACDPNYPNNVHKTFMMTEGETANVGLSTTVENDGNYDVWAISVNKCHDASPVGNLPTSPYGYGVKVATIHIPEDKQYGSCSGSDVTTTTLIPGDNDCQEFSSYSSKISINEIISYGCMPTNSNPNCISLSNMAKYGKKVESGWLGFTWNIIDWIIDPFHLNDNNMGVCVSDIDRLYCQDDIIGKIGAIAQNIGLKGVFPYCKDAGYAGIVILVFLAIMLFSLRRRR